MRTPPPTPTLPPSSDPDRQSQPPKENQKQNNKKKNNPSHTIPPHLHSSAQPCTSPLPSKLTSQAATHFPRARAWHIHPPVPAAVDPIISHCLVVGVATTPLPKKRRLDAWMDAGQGAKTEKQTETKEVSTRSRQGDVACLGKVKSEKLKRVLRRPGGYATRKREEEWKRGLGGIFLFRSFFPSSFPFLFRLFSWSPGKGQLRTAIYLACQGETAQRCKHMFGIAQCRKKRALRLAVHSQPECKN